MRKSSVNPKNGLALSFALILGIITVSVNAQTRSYEMEHNEGTYVHDTSGKIVRSGTGLCWHTHFGFADDECKSMPRAKAVAPASFNKPTPILPSIQTVKPVTVPELTIVTIKKVTLDSIGFFDFDKATLRPSARAELDSFVENLKNIIPQTITIIGYADRFGSTTYNQNLSEQRAASVKIYLVKTGISSDIIFTEGKGEAQQVTNKGQCPGGKTPRTISCLQPDRRVEVEMTGTMTKP
ncbi:MAG: OmpA family protein [Candidatus Nitrotoga sp.]